MAALAIIGLCTILVGLIAFGFIGMMRGKDEGDDV